MSILNEKNTVLMIIDVQEKLINATFNKEIIEKNSTILAKMAKIMNLPVVITEQYPKGLGETITSIKENLGDNSKIFEKISFSALDNEEVKKYLQSLNRKQILLFGIETHICVSQTANALIEAGYEVHVVSNACGSRSMVEHVAGLERMKGVGVNSEGNSGANSLTTEIALFELLRTAKHEHFKEIQGLIK